MFTVRILYFEFDCICNVCVWPWQVVNKDIGALQSHSSPNHGTNVNTDKTCKHYYVYSLFRTEYNNELWVNNVRIYM
jgi:hypothetical protein